MNEEKIIDKPLIDQVIQTKNKRAELNITKEEISNQTKIPAKYIKIIETLNFTLLPPMPMKKAFILQYCKAVKNISSNN